MLLRVRHSTVPQEAADAGAALPRRACVPMANASACSGGSLLATRICWTEYPTKPRSSPSGSRLLCRQPVAPFQIRRVQSAEAKMKSEASLLYVT